MTSDRCTSLSLARHACTRARLWLLACAVVALSAALGAAPGSTSGWIHEAAAKQVPALYPGFGAAVAANDVGLVAMSSARDQDIGVDAAAVAVAALRRGRFEPAGLARHPGGRSDAGFGISLALDDDNTLYVGAPELDGGAVFIYERAEWSRSQDGGLWQLVAELRAPSPSLAARFGASISVWGRGQGRRLAVGEPDRDAGSQPGIDGFRAGAVHVFERGGAGWIHASMLMAPQAAAAARFGTSLAIHGDTVVIGAPGAPRAVRERTLWSAGDAWCAHRVDGQWQVLQRLSAPRPHALAYFGYGVGFDGVTIAITALREPMRPDSPAASASRRGVVYLFEHAGSGWPTDSTSRTAPWRPVQRLLPPVPEDEHFASSVCVRDGMIAIGAPAAHVVAAQDHEVASGDSRGNRGDSRERPPHRGTDFQARNPACGATYVYEKVHANTWIARARCTAPDANDGARDGVDVSLARRSDGCISVVMSRGGDPEGPPGPGAVHAFTPLTMAVSAIPSKWLAGMG